MSMSAESRADVRALRHHELRGAGVIPKVFLDPRTALRNAMRRSIEQAHYHPERAGFYRACAARAFWRLVELGVA